MGVGQHKAAWVFLSFLLMLSGSAFAAESAKKPVKPPHPSVLKIKPGQHPLQPLINYAKQGLYYLNQEIRDYSCVMIRRERIDGRLMLHEHMIARVRHERRTDGNVKVPFSVFLHFYSPRRVRGRQVAYVAGRNDGKLIVRRGGRRVNITLLVKPKSHGAMRNNRYPITAFGIKNLITRLIAVAEEEVKHAKLSTPECVVKVIPGAKIDKRSCFCIQVTHLVKREHYKFHIARLFIDDALQLPVRFESYDWPKSAGGKPVLVEEYTYSKLKLNRRLTDRHFDLPIPGQKKTSQKTADKIGAR